MYFKIRRYKNWLSSEPSSLKCLLAVCFLSLGLTSCSKKDIDWALWSTHEGKDSLIIAHRGASGYLPEGTLPAYALAYSMGADYLEMDLVMSRDGVPVVFHDLVLEGITDVAEKYPELQSVDGHWYASDLSLDQLTRLNVFGRFEERFEPRAHGYSIATFESVLQLVNSMNRMSGCVAGVYPEIKHSKYHQDRGLPMEEVVIELLAKYGYTGADSSVFIQSFDPQSLLKIRYQLGSDIRLIQLISGGKGSDPMVTLTGLASIAEYAYGIGPSKARIINTEGQLVIDAHAVGLEVHPYTLKSDDVPTQFQSFEQELKLLVNTYGVGGVFTDHPDQVWAFLGRDGSHLAKLARRCSL